MTFVGTMRDALTKKYKKGKTRWKETKKSGKKIMNNSASVKL